MNSKKKILSLCLTAVIIALCVVGVLVFSAGAEEYAATYTVGDDCTDIPDALSQIAAQNRLWAADAQVKIVVDGTADVSAIDSDLLFGQTTIFRADHTKLPITIAFAGRNGDYLLTLPSRPVAAANDYRIFQGNIKVPNGCVFYAGCGKVTFDNPLINGDNTTTASAYGIFAADNFTAEVYTGWTAEDIAANQAADGKLESEMYFYKTVTRSGNTVHCYASYFEGDPTLNDTTVQTYTYPAPAAYAGPTVYVKDTRASFVYNHPQVSLTQGRCNAKRAYNPCEAVLHMMNGSYKVGPILPSLSQAAAGYYESYGDITAIFDGDSVSKIDADFLRGSNSTFHIHGKYTITVGHEGGEGPTIPQMLQWNNTTGLTATDGFYCNLLSGTFTGTGTNDKNIYTPYNMNGYAQLTISGTTGGVTVGTMNANGGTATIKTIVNGDANLTNLFVGSAQTNKDLSGFTYETVIEGNAVVGTYGPMRNEGSNNNAGNVTNTVRGNATVTNFFGGDSSAYVFKATSLKNYVQENATITNFYGAAAKSFDIDLLENHIEGGTITNFYGAGGKTTGGSINEIGDLQNYVTGGTITNYYGGTYVTPLTGDIVNNISGGTIETKYYGGSYGASGKSGDDNTTIITGSIFNNISGGTFNCSYTIGGTRGETGGNWNSRMTGDVTNTISGGTFNGNFMAGVEQNVAQNGAPAVLPTVTTNISGTADFKQTFYALGGFPNSANIVNNISGGTIANFYGAGGTNTGLNNGADGSIQNNVYGGTITNFFGGANLGHCTAPITNNVYGGTFQSFICGNKEAADDNVLETNIYGGTFNARILASSRNHDTSTYVFSTTPVVNFYTGPDAVSAEAIAAGASADSVITLNGKVHVDYFAEEPADGTNACVNFIGGSKAILINQNFNATATSVTGSVTFTQTGYWVGGTTYFTAPSAAEALVTMANGTGVVGSVSVENDGTTATWIAASGNTVIGGQLVIDDRISVRVYFNKDEVDAATDWSFTITGVHVPTAITGTKADLSEDADGYYYTLPSIAASQLRRTYTLNASTNEHKTFSVMTLCNTGIEVYASDAELVDLFKAIFNYGAQAYKQYVASTTDSFYEGVDYTGVYDSDEIDASGRKSADNYIVITGVALDLGGAVGIHCYVKAPDVPTISVDGDVLAADYYTCTAIPEAQQASFGGATYDITFSVKASSFTTGVSFTAQIGEYTATIANVSIPSVANMNTNPDEADMISRLLAYVEAVDNYLGAQA